MNRGGGIWIVAFLLAGLAHAGLLGLTPPLSPPESRAPGAADDPLRIELGAAPSPPNARTQNDIAEALEAAPKSEPQRQPELEPQPEAEPEAGPSRAPEPEPQPTPDASIRSEPETSPQTQAAAAAAAPPPARAPVPTDAGEPIPGKGSAAARRDYLQTLRTWLAKHQRYPRRARLRGLEGDAVVRLRFDDDAILASVNVAAATGHQSLNEALAAMLRRARPLPTPPDDADVGGRTIDVPIRFSLRDHGGGF